MKRNILYFAFAAFLVLTAACTPKEEIGFHLDTDEITVGPEGGVRTIKLEAGEPWTAMTNEPWIAISPANGKGSEECRVIIDSTLITDVREDVVTIQTASGTYKEFTVKQDGFAYQINVKKPLVEIEDFAVLSERKFVVVVNTNVDFTIEIPEECKEWLSYEPYDVNEHLDRGARPRNVTLRFNWKVNPTKDQRDALVNFLAKVEADVNADVLKVSQGAAPNIEDFKNTRAGDSLALLSISRFLGCWSEYDTGLRLDRWEGVTIHKSGVNKGRVKSADFIFFDTDEPLPYAVKYLTAAEELYFFSNVNSFQKNISMGEDICELKNLKRLTMFAYGLTELPKNIGKMESLRFLDLGGNNFASVPKQLQDCKSLTALIMTSNQRKAVHDLSNTVYSDIGGLIEECPADGEGKMKFPTWLLKWNQLDTLRLSVNYLQGTLPTDKELVADGFPSWDVENFDASLTEVNLKDSLSTGGINLFTENKIPMVLPDIDFFSINLNRLSGEIPMWLKYHPKLDYWTPLLLVFPQEGKDQNGVTAGFKDVPTNLNYYYEVYQKKKWSSINVAQ